MRRTSRFEWILIALCVALVVFVGFACMFDDDGDVSLSLYLAEHPACSPGQITHAFRVALASRPLAGPVARSRIYARGLLAAVPGGLCLLI